MGQTPGSRGESRETMLLIERGAQLYAAGRLDEALTAWRQAQAAAPADVRARAYVAWGEFKKRVLDERASSERTTAELQAARAPAGDARQPPTGEPRRPPTGEMRRPAVAGEARRPSTAEMAASRPSAMAADGLVTTGRRTTGEMVAPGAAPPPRLGQRTLELPSIGAADLAAAASQHSATVGERVQDFLGRTPTRQNLRLVDVWELDDRTIADLANQGKLRAGLAADAEVEAQATDPEERLRVARSLLVSAGQAADRGDFNVALAHVERAVAFMGGLERLELGAEPVVTRIYEHHLGERGRTLTLGDVPRSLEPRAAYLLSRIDGMMTIDDVIDISGMPRLEVIRRLALLLHEGALTAL